MHLFFWSLLFRVFPQTHDYWYFCGVNHNRKTVMKLITSEESIRKYIPNVLVSVKGEVPLIDKLTPFLDLAEEWLSHTFTSEATLDTIVGYPDSSVIKIYACKVVVCEAFKNAVPSLDLVLTPNGFGIVNNSNVVPASKERVNRLIDSLEAERDNAIRLLLSSLPGDASWITSNQCAYFSATMFPNLDICDYLGCGNRQWRKYQEIRPSILEIEEHIATQFLGTEQLDVFRKEAMSPSSTSYLMKSVIRSLRAYEAQVLKNKLSTSEPSVCTPPTALVSIVNTIRNHPDEFPLWHSSSIAELYKPAIFENKKKDTGYWF